MNYVGSISIIDRGDAPAKAIIDKNTRSLAQRVADETKEELDKVMDRVDNIYVSYEMATQTMFENPRGSPNVEYIGDIKELEEILTDTVKKKKYQQQVTVFVVGFQDVCSQKMQLLQQVNQFFLDNSKLDEDEVIEQKPELDLEEASNKVHESLTTAEELAKRLGDLNQDIIEWLVNYANTKASNKGKKRLEKSLEAAKNDVTELGEKLLKLQTEIEEKDEKFQQLVKQLDAKTQEVIRYKTAAEVAKKSAQDNEAHTAVLQDEIIRRDEKILELRTKLSRLEINLTESQFDKELSTRKLDKVQVQTKVRFVVGVEIKEKLSKLQEEVQSQKIAVSDAEREMEKLHKEQLINLQQTHQQEIEELRKEHEDEIVKLTGKSIGEISVGEDENLATKQESRPSTKDTKSSKKSESLKTVKPAKSPNRLGKDKGRNTKDYADASIQDEGGDASKAFIEKSNEPSRQPTRQSKNLEPVIEGDGSEFPNSFDLDDNESWSGVPSQQVPGRFTQYRRLTMTRIKELEDQLQVTLTKTHRKVNSLKSQFNEHKGKWETERKILIEQVEQAQKLQTDAEKEADAAMTQLEEFINEQEKLEDEEEQKRQEIIKSMSRPGTVKQMTPAPTEPKPVTPDTKPVEQPETLQTEQSEQELTNLMQQTDDAKAQKNSRNTGAASAPPTVEPNNAHSRKLSQIEREPITGTSEEEVRQSSAKSRASLRNQFKSRLDETRHAVEERRTKSPIIMVPAQKSIDDELITDDEGDIDLPIPDDQKEIYQEDTMDAGTSPPPARRISTISRKSTKLGEHPIVLEYLRAYTGIHNFKEAMSRVLIDKEQMSASQILTDLDRVPFDKDGAVVPQVANMTENIYYVLNEVSQVINSVLQNDRGPVVSSLMMGMSRDATQRTILREKSGMTVDFHPETRGSQRTISTKAGSMSTDAVQYQELQAQYEKLQNQMADDGKKYEEQQRHNVVVMMEMQDTINQLQRELSSLGKQNRRPTSGSPTVGNQNADSAIMFTRLDSERNAKIMKKAVIEQKLDTDKYKDAMHQMDEYVNLPAQRLAHLVKKYVHHCRMKEIEENVQKSQSLNENVFELFDKMEALQNQRAKRWANRMDEMGLERYRLANMLMETLDTIEQESGIFLIKPMYSYRGREPKEHHQYGGKITRPFRPHRTLSPLRDSNSAHAPAPTPASNMRPQRNNQYPQDVGQVQYVPKGPIEGDSTGLMGSSVNYVTSQPRATWSMSDSQIGIHSPTMGNVNTPRILELDINRMMIGQNTISAQIGSPGLSNDRLVNAANNNLRSYMTVNRPGPNSAGKTEPTSAGSRQSPRPSSSPTNHSASTAKRVRLSDVEIPTVMSSSQPLPPIGAADRPRSSSSKGRLSPARIPVGNELPESPPGSSLRQSPVQEADADAAPSIK